MKRTLSLILAVMIMALAFPSIALAQDVFPVIPDNTVSVVQLWMVAFGIITTALASLMRFISVQGSPMHDLPDIAKKLIVVVISLVLAAIGLAVQNDFFPETYVRAALTILIVASGVYALIGKTIQDQVAGVKTIAVVKSANVDRGIAASQVVDPGH